MKPSHRIMAVVGSDTDLNAVRGLREISSLVIRKRSYSIELDFHTDKPENVHSQLAGITEIEEFKDLKEEEISYTKEYFQSLLDREGDVIGEARKMFEEERYWEAHTVLEDLWKASAGSKKKTLQGIIIIAASLTHYQMNETDVAERMYRKGLRLIKEGSGKSAKEYGYDETFSYPCRFPEVF